jgi:4-amino-4-deoxy-L-arabinose transferase-like glycosyltransferase
VSLPSTRVFALLILLVYIIVGVLFAVITPPWQAPDEPAHYNTIRQVAENGCCPTIELGDWQLAYQNELVSARFAPELLDRLETIQYEDHQPPLYYLLSSVVYRLFNGSLTALRIFSVLIGTGLVACMFAIVQRLFPDRPGVVIGSTLLFAFIPQHMAMLSAVNNDGLSELFIALTLLATINYLTSETETQLREWVLGLLVGAIFITKSTGYFMAAVVPIAIVWRNVVDGGYVTSAYTASRIF